MSSNNPSNNSEKKRPNPQQQTGPPNKKTYIDSKTGKKINDYIPKFISNQPWYYSNDSLTVDSNSRVRKTDDELYKELTDKSNDRLRHQRLESNGGEIVKNNEPRKGSGIVDEIKVVEEIAEKTVDEKKEQSWRKKVREWKKKGRCDNCGGKHKRIDCMEKPHRVSYIYRRERNEAEGLPNQSKYYVKEDTQNWDTKRDRWHGISIDEQYEDVVKNLKNKEEKVLKEYLKSETVDDKAKVEKKDKVETEENAIQTDTIRENEEKEPLDKLSDKDVLIKAILKNNPLAQDPANPTVSRSLEEKPRYLEVIKTGEELRYNPKSRVYKDLSEGYLNERGQFIPYLTGEAAEFEKMKKFTRTVQTKQRKIWNDDKTGTETFAKKEFSNAISPTATMLKMKEKQEKDELIKEAKRKELLEKYGAL